MAKKNQQLKGYDINQRHKFLWMNQQFKALILAMANIYQKILLQRNIYIYVHATIYRVYSQPRLVLWPLATFYLQGTMQKMAKGDKTNHGWEYAL